MCLLLTTTSKLIHIIGFLQAVLIITEFFSHDINQKCSFVRKICSLQMGVRGNRTSCKQGLGDMEVVVKTRDL